MENQKHIIKVKNISEKITKAFNEHKKLRVFHGTSNTSREINFKKDSIIDLSDFKDILEVNEKELFIWVEPNVTMQELLQATLTKNLTPPVVMEFPNITVGGGIQGGAFESSSFKQNLFHHSCEEYEIVLGNGEIKNVSKNNNPELFWAIASSYGSLAIITKVKIKLVKALPLVKIKYFFVRNSTELVNKLNELKINKDVDFIDGIMFSLTGGIVMAGTMSGDTISITKSFSKRTDNWFYLHIEDKFKKQDLSEDVLSLTEYLFRYNRGAFWMSKFYFEYFKLPFLRIIRQLLDQWLDAKNLYRALHAANQSQKYLLQDFSIPSRNVTEFINYTDKNLNVYPLWVCPLASSNQMDFLSPNYLDVDSIVNIGVYTKFDKGYKSFVETNMNLENIVTKLGGRKLLYAHQYYSEEKFWKIYNRSSYEKLRIKYFASEVFPDIYEKTNVRKEYITKFFRAVIELLRNPDKLKVQD